MRAANANRSPAYWLDAGRIMTAGILGARFVGEAEAGQLAGYYGREAIAANVAGQPGAASYCAHRASDLLQCIGQREAAQPALVAA